MSIADGYSPDWWDRAVPPYTRSHAAALAELQECRRQFDKGAWCQATAHAAGRLQTRIPVLEDEVTMAYATENPDWEGSTDRERRTIRVVRERAAEVVKRGVFRVANPAGMQRVLYNLATGLAQKAVDYMQDQIDEEGCGPVFAAFLYGRPRHED